MKSKKDRFDSLFVDIKKRSPPNNETKILYKNKEGGYGMTNGVILNTQQRQVEEGIKVPENLKHTGYHAISWTTLY